LFFWGQAIPPQAFFLLIGECERMRDARARAGKTAVRAARNYQPIIPTRFDSEFQSTTAQASQDSSWNEFSVSNRIKQEGTRGHPPEQRDEFVRKRRHRR
jgi:hypothetical protein